MTNSWDLIIAGGGLAGSLTALRIAQEHPSWRILLLERGGRLGGDHTWSFHSTDLSESELAWISPLVSRSWPRHELRFPGFDRVVNSSYHSLRSSDLHARIAPVLGDRVRFGSGIHTLDSSGVLLNEGVRLTSRVVLDARGFDRLDPLSHGYQKFVGLELEMEEPHDLTHPILMDACCEQKDGFRFVYLLPWSDRSVLVEDTRYSDSPDLDIAEYETGILHYAQRMGWGIKEVLRRETGTLPIPLCETRLHSCAGFETASDSAVPIGVRAGLFHPTTGYSLPAAVRLATMLAALPKPEPCSFLRVVAQARRLAFREGRFFRLLNRMLFRAAAPEARREVFQRFYRLDEARISRFYAGRLGWSDPWAILLGERPPVSLFKAIGCLFPSGGKVA